MKRLAVKMKQDISIKIALPERVSAKVVDTKKNIIEVTGPKGSIVRKLTSKNFTLDCQGSEILVLSKSASKREKKILFTMKSHINNIIKGVTKGHEYRLKICSGHFPMSVGMKGDVFEIKNFIGEKVPRTVKVKKGAEVKIEGEIVVVSGIEKELVSTVASSIELLTRRPGFDHRVFQDGIYMIEKDGKAV
ncbi:50S ribosomal protein L6 [Candidatus Woesearchaeota archaeon]|nr:50S ribosomal protein L6 [Candidatus Woesearchaeota archaeon]